MRGKGEGGGMEEWGRMEGGRGKDEGMEGGSERAMMEGGGSEWGKRGWEREREWGRICIVLIIHHHRPATSTIIVDQQCQPSSLTSNIVHPCHLSLLVGGVHCLQVVVAISIECGGCGLCLRMPVVVCGWLDGCSSSLVCTPGLWAVVLCSFGGLLLVASGGEWCRSWVVVAIVDRAWWWWWGRWVFADTCHHSRLLMVAVGVVCGHLCPFCMVVSSCCLWVMCHGCCQWVRWLSVEEKDGTSHVVTFTSWVHMPTKFV